MYFGLEGQTCVNMCDYGINLRVNLLNIAIIMCDVEDSSRQFKAVKIYFRFRFRLQLRTA